MVEINELLRKLESVAHSRPQYKLDSYSFVLAALNFTVGRFPKPKHVTGPELCNGIREFALTQYGPLARQVLQYWGIERTRDFGELVFALIDAGLMSKTDEDKISDFDDVYDFSETFDKGYDFDVDELDLSFVRRKQNLKNDPESN